jgi:NadR type nicotinamide-nucleotide adenylyltransferase
MIKKIVAIGPESTGKSSLCKELAVHYNSVYAKEYAREYLLSHGTQYSFDNLLDIAKGQIQLEENAISAIENLSPNNLYHKPLNLFLDTDMYVMKVWCEFVFDQCHHWILNNIASRKYDLYLLCNTDMPWVKDELREYPDLATREKLYRHYKDILVNQQVPWIDISGNYEERLQKAIAAVEGL